MTEFYFSTLATVIPTAYLEDFVAYASRFENILKHDDMPLSQFIAERRLPALVAVPALVEHGNYESVAGNRSHGDLHAACFMGEQTLQARPYDRVAHSFRLCPHFEAGRVDFWVRVDVLGQERWARTPWPDFAEQLSIDPADLRDTFKRCFLASGLGASVADDVDPEYIFGMWTLAFLLATLVRRNQVPTLPPSSCAPVDGEVPDALSESLKTLGVGCARFTTVGLVGLRKHARRLHEFTLEAYHLGLTLLR